MAKSTAQDPPPSPPHPWVPYLEHSESGDLDARWPKLRRYKQDSLQFRVIRHGAHTTHPPSQGVEVRRASKREQNRETSWGAGETTVTRQFLSCLYPSPNPCSHHHLGSPGGRIHSDEPQVKCPGDWRADSILGETQLFLKLCILSSGLHSMRLCLGAPAHAPLETQWTSETKATMEQGGRGPATPCRSPALHTSPERLGTLRFAIRFIFAVF